MASGNNMPAHIRQLNSAPTYFMRKSAPGNSSDDVRLPPISSVFVSASNRDTGSSHYATTSEVCFSPMNRQGFPEELLPFRTEIQRYKDNRFTDSFVAGAYRDSRMGVAEMRAKRIERLRKQQASVEAAQQKVMQNLRRLERERKRAAAEERLRKRLEQMNMMTNVALVLQKTFRGRAVRKRMAQLEALREQERLAAAQEVAASKLQRWALECLARAYAKMNAYEEEEEEEGEEEEESGEEEDDDELGEEAGEGEEEEGADHVGGVGGLEGEHGPLGGDGVAGGSSGACRTSKEGGGSVNHLGDTASKGDRRKSSLRRQKSRRSSEDGTDKPSRLTRSASLRKSKLASSRASSQRGFLPTSRIHTDETPWERSDRIQRELEDLLAFFQHRGVSADEAHGHARAVQKAARSMFARHRTTTIRNALVLLRWFFAKYLKSTPLYMKLEANYLGRPMWDPRVPHSVRTHHPLLVSRRLRDWQKERAHFTVTTFGGLVRLALDAQRAVKTEKELRRPKTALHIFDDNRISESYKFSRREAERLKDVVRWEQNRANAATKLQAAFRGYHARRVFVQRMAQAKEAKIVEATRIARAMMLRIPQEAPDLTATTVWLSEEDSDVDANRMYGKRRRPGPPVGPVDLRRTTRQPFWLEGGDDHGEKVRNAAVGMPNLGKGPPRLAALNRGPSAPSLLSAGLKGYYSPMKPAPRY